MNRNPQNSSPTEYWRSREDNNGVYLSRRSNRSTTRPLFLPYASTTRVLLVSPINTQIPGEEVLDHWPLFQERVINSPFEVAQYPGVPYVANQTSIPDIETTTSNLRQRGSQPPSPRSNLRWSVQFPREVGSRLSAEEQKEALNKLKKETYYPTHKRVSRMPNLYYRNYDINNIKKSNNASDDEDGKRCSICLEDFEPKEVVTVTPCKHMFHEDCIVPWVKSHGKCPVCRFAIYDKPSVVNNVASSNNGASNESDMISMIRNMDQTYVSQRRRFLMP